MHDGMVFHSSLDIKEPSRVGAALQNLGNTCFLNAVLQCITHTIPLAGKICLANHFLPCHPDWRGGRLTGARRRHGRSGSNSQGCVWRGGEARLWRGRGIQGHWREKRAQE